jgi:3-phenylpropionate/cinnamic acid dioxygenase small subunit
LEVWELMARESIRDLVARYNANADAGRFAQVLELFADDAAMEVATAAGEVQHYEGHGEIATLFSGTKHRWDTGAAAGPSRRHHVRHFVSTHQIDIEDRTHATGRSYFAVLMPHGLDHWGRYLDAYEERGGRWLFTRRRALPDGSVDPAGG